MMPWGAGFGRFLLNAAPGHNPHEQAGNEHRRRPGQTLSLLADDIVAGIKEHAKQAAQPDEQHQQAYTGHQVLGKAAQSGLLSHQGHLPGVLP